MGHEAQTAHLVSLATRSFSTPYWEYCCLPPLVPPCSLAGSNSSLTQASLPAKTSAVVTVRPWMCIDTCWSPSHQQLLGFDTGNACPARGPLTNRGSDGVTASRS